MSARDDYPRLAWMEQWDADDEPGCRAALDEIDALRDDCAEAEDYAAALSRGLAAKNDEIVRLRWEADHYRKRCAYLGERIEALTARRDEIMRSSGRKVQELAHALSAHLTATYGYSEVDPMRAAIALAGSSGLDQAGPGGAVEAECRQDQPEPCDTAAPTNTPSLTGSPLPRVEPVERPVGHPLGRRGNNDGGGR